MFSQNINYIFSICNTVLLSNKDAVLKPQSLLTCFLGGDFKKCFEVYLFLFCLELISLVERTEENKLKCKKARGGRGGGDTVVSTTLGKHYENKK